MADLKEEEKDDVKNQPQTAILQDSMNEVRAEEGRLFKVLPAIEAATEYIGDYVYYQMLLHHLPDYIQKEYLPILASKNKKKLKKDLGLELGLDIAEATKYVVFPDVAKPTYCEIATKIGGYRPKDIELTKPPIQIPLEYSRPLYKADKYPEFKSDAIITKDVFTVRNVEEVAVIAWLDSVFMNDDRFNLDGKVANTKNMMLAPKTKGFAYVPIDQGFSRQLTAAWFHWLRIEANRYPTWPKYPKKYKQLIYSEQWIKNSNDKTPNSKRWMKAYKIWINKNTNKAKEFVARNHEYFPDDAAMREKAGEIIDIYWNVHGAELCVNIGSLVHDIFSAFNNQNPNIPNIPELIQQSEAKWKQKQASKNKKNKKKKKKKKHKKDELGYIKDYKDQWKKVKQLIAAQIKQCAKFKPVAGVDESKKMKAIREAAKADTLLKDFTFQQLQNLNDDEKQTERTRRRSVSKSIDEINEDNFLQDVLDELIASPDPPPVQQVVAAPVVTGPRDSTHLAKQLEINEYYDGNYYDALSVPYYQQNEYEYVLHPDPVQTLLTMEVIFVFAFLVLICVGCFIIGAFMGMVAVNRVNLAFKKKPETIRINDEESQ